MYSVTVKKSFCAAHFLNNYCGKCEKLHGHNYKVKVKVKGKTLDKGGMLVDFTLLKEALEKVFKTLDHSLLNENPYFSNNPSAELIAKYIYERLEESESLRGIIGKRKSEGLPYLHSVSVYETKNNKATYYKE